MESEETRPQGSGNQSETLGGKERKTRMEIRGMVPRRK